MADEENKEGTAREGVGMNSMEESEQSKQSEQSMANEEEIYTERDSLNEIRKWMLGEGKAGKAGSRESTPRPLWQQEALQRLYENGSLGGGSDGNTGGNTSSRDENSPSGRASFNDVDGSNEDNRPKDGSNGETHSIEENLEQDDWRDFLEIIKGDNKQEILRDEYGQVRLTLGQTAPKQAVSNEQPSPLDQSQGKSQDQSREKLREQKSQGGKIQDQSSPLEQSREQKPQAEKSNKQIAKNQAAEKNSDKPQNIVLTEIANVRGVDALVGGQCLSFVGKEKDDKKNSGGGAVKEDDTFSADDNLTGGNDGSTSGSPILSSSFPPLLPPENSPNKAGGNLHFLHSPGGLALLYGDNGSGKSSYARILANACDARKAEKILSNLKKGAAEESIGVQHEKDASTQGSGHGAIGTGQEKGGGSQVNFSPGDVDGNLTSGEHSPLIDSKSSVGGVQEDAGVQDASAQGNVYPSAVLKYWAYDRADGGKAGKAEKAGSSAVGDDGDTSSHKGRSAEFKAVRWWYVKGKNYFREIDFENPDKDQVNFPFADVGGGQSDPAQDKASKDIAKQLAEVRVFSDATASVHSEANKAIYTPYPKLLLDQLANACEKMEWIIDGEISRLEDKINKSAYKAYHLIYAIRDDWNDMWARVEREEFSPGKFKYITEEKEKRLRNIQSKKFLFEKGKDNELVGRDEGEMAIELLFGLFIFFGDDFEEVRNEVRYSYDYDDVEQLGNRIEYLDATPFDKEMKWRLDRIQQWLEQLSPFSKEEEKELQEAEQWIAWQDSIKKEGGNFWGDEAGTQLAEWVKDEKKQRENIPFDELEQKIKELNHPKKSSEEKSLEEYQEKMERLNHLRSRRWLVTGDKGDGKKGTSPKEIFAKTIKHLRELGKEQDYVEDWNSEMYSIHDLKQKGEEEAAKLVGPRWQKNFKRELEQLGLGQLGLEVRPIVKDGETRYQIGFADGSLGGNKLDRVLSGGEFRGAALAAFLAEDVTEGNRSAIIFDDPVSSLDHNYRQKFAHRLATLSKQRQVIVFTHDLMFLWLLQNEIEEQSGWVQSCTISRATDFDGRNLIGFCAEGLPFGKQRPGDALCDLGRELKNLEKKENRRRAKQINLAKKDLPSAEGGGTDRRDEDDWFIKKMGCCVTFRQLCEKAVEEAIPVFKRLDDDISVSRLKMVTVIDKGYYKRMKKLFGKYSSIVHYGPPNLLPQLPSVEELLADVDTLREWMKDVQVAQGILKKSKKVQ